MKILTTSDLSYVGGGADGESSQRGGGWYDDGESCHAGVSPEQQAANEAFANGMSLIVTNPEAAAASYMIQFYNMYRNPSNYQTVPYSNPMGDNDGGY